MATSHWQPSSGAFNGNWTDPLHWSPTLPASSSDAVIFDAGYPPAYNVSFNANAVCGPISTVPDGVAFLLNGNMLTTGGDITLLSPATAGTGLEISGGTLNQTSASLLIAYNNVAKLVIQRKFATARVRTSKNK